jgi:adenine specific DNA methylase Mod
MSNALYYGDNLAVLRESIATESVDLIYLDPPFNSNASYNLLFKSPSGAQSPARPQEPEKDARQGLGLPDGHLWKRQLSGLHLSSPWFFNHSETTAET